MSAFADHDEGGKAGLARLFRLFATKLFASNCDVSVRHVNRTDTGQ